MSRWLLAGLALAATPALAADLASIPRTIAKEPTFQGKPAYCLLVFGPDTTHRVWLVRDGGTLHADKNGNGDLTDPGEKIAAEDDSGDPSFTVGTVKVGGREHRNVVVRAGRLAKYVSGDSAHPVAKAALAKDKDAELMMVGAEVAVPGLKGQGDDGRVSVFARWDANGPLLFGDSAATAPILHLGGPLRVQPEDGKLAVTRNVVHDLMLTVGTPGVGPGTFASVAYDGVIPKEAFVVAEAEWPGEPPVKAKYELKERC